MTDRVIDRRPPLAVARAGNPLLRAVLRSPLGRRIGNLAVLEFTGRRTGRPYRVVVGWNELDGSGLVFTNAAWAANFAGGRAATVRHRGAVGRWRGELEADPARVASALNELIDGGLSPAALGLRVAPGHRITGDEIADKRRALVRFSRGHSA